MAERLSPAKAVLLAVELAAGANITELRSLISQYRKALRTDIVLRILLSYLPETLDTSEYVPFLKDLASGNITSSDNYIDTASVKSVEEHEAAKKVRKLKLEPLLWKNAPADVPTDSITLFLIHRAYKIDQETGLSTQLPDLIGPFLERSPFLRAWMINTLLPLLRLNYEYYPQVSTSETIASFEAMGDRPGVNFLLSHTGKSVEGRGDSQRTVGRDLRGLVGPWMYGDNRWKRRKLRRTSTLEARTVAPLEKSPNSIDKYAAWEEVFRWITSQASTSWLTCVDAIEQWDGPGDVDLGGYSDGTTWLEEHEQQELERQYARAALSSAYIIPEASVDALNGAHRILSRLVALLDYDHLPSLTTAASLLSPVTIEDATLQTPENASFLRSNFMDPGNKLTTPSRSSIELLNGLLLSSFLISRLGFPCSIRKVGQLALVQDENDQLEVFRGLLVKISDGPKGDDKYWIRARNELLWLHSWGSEELSETVVSDKRKGVFGKVKRDFLEKEFLKALLANTRYTLARSIYETSSEQLLTREQLRETIVSAAMKAYDNASNANRTRGGVKKCDDIMSSFPDTMNGTEAKRRNQALLKVTHSIGKYRLVLKQGEPFAPVDLHVHKDPIALIGKVLEQNPQSYAKMQEFVDMATDMVEAGLTDHNVEASKSRHTHHEAEHKDTAVKRVQAMCIDAALNEDDFETAYSYIMTRLSVRENKAQKTVSCLECEHNNVVAEPAPITLDDWSWRAALQAGKYRMNSRTVRPTHVGNASGNLEIRHLEQRQECISLALRIAPPAAIQELLNVFRRCEEELDVKLKEEAEAEAAWDDQGDQTSMPGGFGAEPKPTTLSRHSAAAKAEEGPLSIFDLTKASASSAQKTLSALSSLRLGSAKSHELSASDRAAESARSSGELPRDGTTGRVGARKRDQLREAAVGTLASSVGWLIGAPTRPESRGDSE